MQDYEAGDGGGEDRTGLHPADFLLLLPFIWQLGLAPLANAVAWRPFDLPFAMVWQMAGILFATMILTLRYSLDRRNRSSDSETPR